MQNKIDLDYIVDAMMVDFKYAPVDVQDTFMNTPRSDLCLYHHGLGTQIRNRFHLWEHKWEPVLENGIDVSPNHPDAISMRVIEMIWDRLDKERVTVTQNLIKQKMSELKEQQTAIDVAIRNLQETCTHPNSTKHFRADTGNWCKSDDRYWVDYECPDCGKKWEEKK